MTHRDPATMSDEELAAEMAALFGRLDELEAEYEKRNDVHEQRAGD